MVDHPLIPDDVRIYMQKHQVFSLSLTLSQIERFLNQGLNEVLKSFPQDPLSVIAATLIDVTLKFKPHFRTLPIFLFLKDFMLEKLLQEKILNLSNLQSTSTTKAKFFLTTLTSILLILKIQVISFGNFSILIFKGQIR